ncbi:MAG: hypothetical protein ACE5EX_08175 [Phycisphaerae bacterium]
MFSSAPATHANPPPVSPPVALARAGQLAPGDTGRFKSFGGLQGFSPSIDGDNIAFGAFTDGGGGIYAFIGGRLRVVADTATKVPGTNVNFSFGLPSGSGPSISGRNVVFLGTNPLEGDGVWVWSDGVLTQIAGQSTPVPGGTGTFSTFGAGTGVTPAISGENVVFNAVTNTTEGIYAFINGQLRVIADTSTLLPGATRTVTTFGFGKGVSPAISGENVAFYAQWGFDGEGIYAFINGEFRVIAATGTPIPGLGGPAFGHFLSPSPAISGENVVFAETFGIFAMIDGSLRAIATSDIPAPGSSGGFGAVVGTERRNRPSIDGENIAFAAFALDIGLGVFALIEGEYCLIAGENMPVPGGGGTFFNFNAVFDGGVSPAISGRQVAFVGRPFPTVYLGNGPATIPAIPTWGWIALALLMVVAGTFLIRRRRVAKP